MKERKNNYIDIEVIQEIYQSEGQHCVPIAHWGLARWRLLLRLRANNFVLISIFEKKTD